MKPTGSMCMPSDVPGYEVLRRIGRGGMGDVYVARQFALDRLVAIKFLHLEGGVDLAERVARFEREGRMMAGVSHPNILAAYDFQYEDGRPYLVMEYVEAGDLRRQMTPGRPMDVARVRSILTPVGDALECLHHREILHRDLKPENILMHEESNPKVADFGIAVLRAVAKGGSGEVAAAGTLGYVAPEQHDRLKVDERADQYSLAAVAYEMLTGEVPLGTTFKPPSYHNRALVGGVDAAIMRALSYDKADRYETLREFRADLDRALAESPRRPGAARGRWALIGAMALGCVAVGTALVRSPLSPWAGGPAIRVRDAGRPVPGKDDPPVRPPAAPERDAAKQIERQAYAFWLEEGAHEGDPKKVRDERWGRAVARVNQEIERLALAVYKRRGSPKQRTNHGADSPHGDWLKGRRQFDKQLDRRLDELDRRRPVPKPAEPPRMGPPPSIEVIE